MNVLDRVEGSLLGLAVGDALGSQVEFAPPGSFDPVTDLAGGGPWHLPVGAWTDDTSMALCLADSLIAGRGFDPVDQLDRYVRWWRTGYRSAIGHCFDIGGTTAEALRRFEQSRNPYCGSTDPHKAGNGSLMRLAPVPLFFHRTPVEAITWAGQSSRTTHGARTCVDACRYAAGLIVGALAGATKEELLGPAFAPVDGLWMREPLTARINAVAGGSFKQKQPPAIRGTGYVVDTFEAALWAFWTTDTFTDGVLAAVNLGDDADTVGAVYGQIAGAYYGVDAIPRDWRERIVQVDAIRDVAERLAVGAPGDDRATSSVETLTDG